MKEAGLYQVRKGLAISPLGGYDKSTMTLPLPHTEVLKRLKRAKGHLKSIVTMLEEGRDCLEVVQQLQAVEKAVANAKKALVHEHIDHCLERAVREGTQDVDKTIREFKEITKYL